MKKLILTCAVLTSVSMGAFAQASQTQTNAAAGAPPVATAPQNMPSPEQMAERRAKMYEQQYKLTPEQYKGIYAAELDFMKQEQQIRKSGAQPGQGQHQQMMMARDQKFKEVMTPEQYTKYQASRPKMTGEAPSAPQQVAPPAGLK